MGRRLHQMIRVKSGDWLLASNDGATLWRMTKSTDGWELWGRPMFGSDAELDAFDWDDWGLWDHHGTHASRQDAIDHAMDDVLLAPAREYEIRDGFLVPKT